MLAHGIAHIALRSATKEATQGEVAQLAMIPAIMCALRLAWERSVRSPGMNFHDSILRFLRRNAKMYSRRTILGCNMFMNRL